MIGNLPNRVGNRAVGQVRIRQIGLVRSGFRTCLPSSCRAIRRPQLGQRAIADPAAVQAFREHYGLDKPLPVQYVVYLEHLSTVTSASQSKSPFGARRPRRVRARDRRAGRHVDPHRLPAGITLGVISAVRRNHLADHVLRVVSLGGNLDATFCSRSSPCTFLSGVPGWPATGSGARSDCSTSTL